MLHTNISPIIPTGSGQEIDFFISATFSKAPVTPSRVSTALVRSCLIMRSAVRLQENPDIFLEKGLSLRPGSDQGVATELAWRSIAFLRSSYWRLSALSRRFHCAFTALTMHALRFHGVCTALTAC